MYKCLYVDIYSCLCSCITDVLMIQTIVDIMIRSCYICWFTHTPEFLVFWCDFLLLPFFFNINLSGSTLLGFLVGPRTTLVKTTSSNRLVVESTWLWVNWSGKLRTKWLLYSEFVNKWLLFISSLLKCNREDLNFVDLRIISSWQWMVAWSIQVRLQGEGDVYPFLPLTFNPSYTMLEGVGLCRGLCCLKEWRRLYLPDLRFCTS